MRQSSHGTWLKCTFPSFCLGALIIVSADWFDVEDSSSLESKGDEMESFSSLDSEEDVRYRSVCVKCGHDNLTAASNKCH